MFNSGVAKAYKSFSDHHDLVIFEDASHEELHPIRGITFAPKCEDEFYMHGNVDGVEATFISRTSFYPAANKTKAQVDWAVGQFQLAKNHGFHTYINHVKHQDPVYRHIFQTYSHLKNIDLSVVNAPIRSFNVYANSSTAVHINQVLTPQFVGHLNEHNNFDYEILNDKLFVYYSGEIKNPEVLNLMLNVGIKITLEMDEL